MTPESPPNRLDRPVDESYDHVLGPSDAEITLVEYGSYADPASRLAHERIAQMRSRFGNRLRYVFRHRPLTGSVIARQAGYESAGAFAAAFKRRFGRTPTQWRRKGRRR